mgnify:CR=1 FL=1
MSKVNHYKFYGYLVLILLAVIYSLPNLFGESPAIQISTPTALTTNQIKEKLNTINLYPKKIEGQSKKWLIKFNNTEEQIKSLKTITKANPNWTTALNLSNNTPQWLTFIGATPMKLGLDLRGGVHFLLNVDPNPIINQRINGDMKDIIQELRKNNVKSKTITSQSQKIIIKFRNDLNISQIKQKLSRYSDYKIDQNKNSLVMSLSNEAHDNILKYTMEQTIQILTNRVNELGISEAVVQQQGETMVSIDLPGIQDTAKAKDLLGSNATISFQLVASEDNGEPILGTKWYTYEQRNVLLYENPILTGSSITFAMSALSDNGHSVSIRLGGGGETKFYRATAENVGKQLAVVYSEKKMNTDPKTGKKTWKVDTNVISVATINQALGNSFEINNLESAEYAEKLALLLRSGALSAPFEIVEETLIGPSMGQENIFKGTLSLIIGFVLVNIFMILYYRTFGLIANFALLLNIIFLISMLSILGNTLTLPGIAGIVLTVGMAVDANVLINERIREELKKGLAFKKCVEAGYNKAFATIVDANVTTLIVAFILFGLGSGTIKGFAITLILGLISSMITSIYITRAIVEFLIQDKEKMEIGI